MAPREHPGEGLVMAGAVPAGRGHRELRRFLIWIFVLNVTSEALILQGLTFPSQQIAILTLNFQTKTFLACNLETKLARGKRGIICDPS